MWAAAVYVCVHVCGWEGAWLGGGPGVYIYEHTCGGNSKAAALKCW